ncbi:hypothetical protein DYB31_004238 [Aphanomyces astaci]|uniref:Uncharacterized protein n=1 Tax=Aphanomyces astaci TaxID=112090 RepID=A0A397F8G4_APHAT|nr:hypothetical protein DYB31_004238 [Aphanomyces astaci]
MRPNLKDVNLERSHAEASNECSSVGSEVNLIDDRTPSKADITHTPTTNVTMVATGSSESPLLTYKTRTNVVFACLQPMVIVGYFILFHGIAAIHPKKNHPTILDSKHVVIGAVAYSSCECSKWMFEWLAQTVRGGTLKDGAMYPWGTVGAVVCTCLDDVVRILFVWVGCSSFTFASAFCFGLGWGCVELTCHVVSFVSVYLHRSWSFHDSTRLQRMLTREGIRHYSVVVLVHHFFSVACGVGAALVAFQSYLHSNVIVLIVVLLRVIGFVAQSESLRRRGSVWTSSLVLFVLQAAVLVLGMSLWQWGRRHHSTHSSTMSRHGHHKGHHPSTPSFVYFTARRRGAG